MIDLNTTLLQASKCCRLIAVSTDTMRTWCNSGQIEAHHGYYKPWRFTAAAFADFLYRNDIYARVYRKKKLSGKDKELQEAIFSWIDAQPELISADDIAAAFGVIVLSVKKWSDKGYIKLVDRMSKQTPLYDFDSVIEMIETNPRLHRKLRTNYTLYNREESKRLLSAVKPSNY